ncbi:hypothetical protein HOL21_02545 [Candidatus Woesearchaeota archaeon]|jgi:hypothetical protein|nr:hypothetical protein [Candidatus Woesearchaeota archaeon]MBT5397070.1 hypothetical protein [Candidatus Woesearchaeota archaeon]MBT6367384.1 hypothetical protein [Candidatus Woesearchaeota archaeon]MBT7762470.1 hypothetical protein [Candidatus Woesearchaeota archaeon]
MQNHYEKNLVINNRELVYKGIFRADELFSTINRALEQRGYTKREKKTEETVTEAGRRTYVELRPFKVINNYAELLIKIKITLDNITETVEEFNNEKRKFQKGDVQMYIDAWLLTDYQSRWGMKPFVWFMKGVINKFVYRWPQEAGFPGQLSEDTAYVYAQIKRILNSYKFDVGKVIREEDVRQQIAEDIQKSE